MDEPTGPDWQERISNLEQRVDALQSENDQLRNENRRLRHERGGLDDTSSSTDQTADVGSATWDRRKILRGAGISIAAALGGASILSQDTHPAGDTGQRTPFAKVAPRPVNVLDTGDEKKNAIADGKLHPAGERFDSVRDAQDVFPHIDSLEDAVDWAAIYAAIATGGAVELPLGHFVINRALDNLTSGTNLLGHGYAQTRLRVTKGNLIEVSNTVRYAKIVDLTLLASPGAGNLIHSDGGSLFSWTISARMAVREPTARAIYGRWASGGLYGLEHSGVIDMFSEGRSVPAVDLVATGGPRINGNSWHNLHCNAHSGGSRMFELEGATTPIRQNTFKDVLFSSVGYGAIAVRNAAATSIEDVGVYDTFGVRESLFVIGRNSGGDRSSQTFMKNIHRSSGEHAGPNTYDIDVEGTHDATLVNCFGAGQNFRVNVGGGQSIIVNPRDARLLGIGRGRNTLILRPGEVKVDDVPLQNVQQVIEDPGSPHASEVQTFVRENEGGLEYCIKFPNGSVTVLAAEV